MVRKRLKKADLKGVNKSVGPDACMEFMATECFLKL